MRIACQGILGTRIGTPSRPGWSWPEPTPGLSRSLAAGGPSARSPGTVTSLLNFSGRRWSGLWGRGVVPWNYPETSPTRQAGVNRRVCYKYLIQYAEGWPSPVEGVRLEIG